MNDLSGLLALDGKTALVTGGGRGLGRAVSLRLAEAGAFVAINYRGDRSAAEKTLEAIERGGGAGSTEQFDVADTAPVDEGVGRILERRGRIDILVNNAGVTRDGLVGRMKDEDWRTVLDTNLSGAFYVSRAAARSMIRNREGRIINIASTAGEAGNAGQANYSAAKAGLIGLTKALARELAPRNILVNAVSPGIIEGGVSADLTREQVESIRSHVPLRRLGAPDEVAYAVLFLASRLSGYVTGQVIGVNGGLYM